MKSISWSAVLVLSFGLAHVTGCASSGGNGTGNEGGSGGSGQGGASATTGPGGQGGAAQGSGGQGGAAQGSGGQGGAAQGGGQGGGGGGCSTDADCTMGKEWCVGGACVPCDNSGLACDIACQNNWNTYERNGCYPCECAPVNACDTDAQCGAGGKCYAGQFCWDWCPPGDPSCCYGNVCSPPGCPDPNPTGCFVTGCPQGKTCALGGACTSSSCACANGNWGCTKDCGGGSCM
jgi:hypothetical protein